MNEVHVRESAETEQAPRIKPVPKTSMVSIPFTYIPCDDGTDENLLMILHGLGRDLAPELTFIIHIIQSTGDTHAPFAKMGRQLKLPQTAILSLRAPEQ